MGHCLGRCGGSSAWQLAQLKQSATMVRGEGKAALGQRAGAAGGGPASSSWSQLWHTAHVLEHLTDATSLYPGLLCLPPPPPPLRRQQCSEQGPPEWAMAQLMSSGSSELAKRTTLQHGGSCCAAGLESSLTHWTSAVTWPACVGLVWEAPTAH